MHGAQMHHDKQKKPVMEVVCIKCIKTKVPSLSLKSSLKFNYLVVVHLLSLCKENPLLDTFFAASITIFWSVIRHISDTRYDLWLQTKNATGMYVQKIAS